MGEISQNELYIKNTRADIAHYLIPW